MAYMYITVSFFETFFKLNIYLNDFYMYFISHFLHGDISSISLDVLSVPMYFISHYCRETFHQFP